MTPRGRILLAALAATVAASAAPAGAADRDEVPEQRQRGPAFVRGEVLVSFEGRKRERVLELPEGIGVRETARALAGRDDVEYAAPNHVARVAAIPNDPGRSGRRGGWVDDQWSFLPCGSLCGGARQPFESAGGIDAPGAWDAMIAAGLDAGGRNRKGKRGPKVAVVDTGVAYRGSKGRGKKRRFRRSPDLARRSFGRGRDFVDGDKLPLDENGHGTHVASTIVEKTGNGRAVTGLAHGAKIFPVRVLGKGGGGTARNVARGIRWATRHGTKIINLSFEFPLAGPGAVRTCADIPGVCKAIERAGRKGALVVAAAGNAGIGQVSYPAGADRPGDPDRVAVPVLGVGASTIRGCLAEYSSHDRGLDLLAPGGGRDHPAAGPHCNPAAPGPGIVQLTLRNRAVRKGNFRRFGFPRYEGTSMASAHATAAAALLRASGSLGKRPRPETLAGRLRDSARGELAGRPLEPRLYGAGLLDAAAAITG